MPDNRSIEIYRKDNEKPVTSFVKSVEDVELTNGGMPWRIRFKTEDGRDGTIFINASETQTVIISPAGVPDRD